MVEKKIELLLFHYVGINEMINLTCKTVRHVIVIGFSLSTLPIYTAVLMVYFYFLNLKQYSYKVYSTSTFTSGIVT